MAAGSVCNRGQTGSGILAELSQGFQGHVPATQRPFVVLLEQQSPDQSVDGGLVGEDADDVGAPLDLAVDT